MPKLTTDEKFIDVSDYGRPIATAAALRLKNSAATPVQVTFVFGLCGLIAAYCILKGYYAIAGLFLILKSIIDAMDGELARIKKMPSYTGRYLDSIFDFILNFIILLSIWYVTDSSIGMMFIAFISLQLQGTLYNYYYVILRHSSNGGDKTSKIFETRSPDALPGEKQSTVNVLFKLYRTFYSLYDFVISRLDSLAPESGRFPKWFMSLLSVYGLGFQLLIMSVMLTFGYVEYIIPFFIAYSLLIFVFIAIRRFWLIKRSTGLETDTLPNSLSEKEE